MSTGNGRQVVLLAGEPRGGGGVRRPLVHAWAVRTGLSATTPNQSRTEALARMVSEAQRRGANAIVAMRFDSGSIGQQWSEICAYGTAVWVTPVSEAAQAQYNAMVASGELPHQQDYAGQGQRVEQAPAAACAVTPC
ncbi:MAG TPA: heavy metal-binding domain-containing protein [Acidimicrobiales bacterium]|nr:heavy metal-binding domain-containing protein [Acidimicrobiales bacterium]